MNKPLIVLYIVTFISRVVEEFVYPIIPLYCQEFHVNPTPTTIGIVMAAAPFFTTISCPIVGKLLDKYEHRYLLGFSILVTAISYASFAIFPTSIEDTRILAASQVAQSSVVTIGELFVLRSMNGIATGIFDTAIVAYGMLASNNAETFNSMWEASIAIGGVVGPVIMYFACKFCFVVIRVLVSIILLLLCVKVLETLLLYIHELTLIFISITFCIQ